MANGWLNGPNECVNGSNECVNDANDVLTMLTGVLTGVLTNVLTRLARCANNLRVTGSIPTLDTRRERPVSGL